MTEPYRSDFCVSLHITCKHSHRIGIVQKQGVGANLLHISCKFFQHRNGAESPHNASDSQCIGNSLSQTVFLGNFKIRNSTGVVSAHLNGIYHKIRIPQSLFSVFRAQIRLNHCPVFVYIVINGAQNNPGILQPLFINVIQSNFALPKRRRTHTIPQYISCKNRAPCTHKCNFYHNPHLLFSL